MKNRSKNDTFFDSIFDWIIEHPQKFISITVISVGFVLRLISAWNANGIYHSDEIYQSLEMAHYIVYDSAIVPPEFKSVNPLEPSYAASRSWIFPWIFAILMFIGEFFNMDYQRGIIPLIRIFLAINSTLLLPAVKKFTKQLTKDEVAATAAMVFVSFWWRIIELTVRPLSNVFFLPMLFYGLYRMLVVLEKELIEMGNYDHMILIFFVGLSTYIRFDLGILVFAVVIVTFQAKRLKYYVEIFYDGLTGWILGIIVDFYYYKKPFSVPINWLTYAIKEGDAYGVSDRAYYFKELVQLDGLYGFSLFSYIIFIIVAYKKYSNKAWKTEFKLNKLEDTYFKLFFINLISWLIFSSVWDDENHKEIRFITAGLVLLLITISVATTLFASYISEYLILGLMKFKVNTSILKSLKKPDWIKISIVVFISLLLVSQSIDFDKERGYVETYDDINLALAYVGQQANVTGVIVVAAWFITGGYTYLHLGAEVEMKFVEINNGIKKDKEMLITWITHWQEGNYLIFPGYQMYRNGDVINELIMNNWEISAVFDGRSYVWVRI